MNKNLFQDTSVDQLSIYNAKKAEMDRKLDNKVRFYTPRDSKKSRESSRSNRSKDERPSRTDELNPNASILQEASSILLLDSKKQSKAASSSAPAIFKIALKLKRLTTTSKIKKSQTEVCRKLSKEDIEEYKTANINGGEARKDSLKTVENNHDFAKNNDLTNLSRNLICLI